MNVSAAIHRLPLPALLLFACLGGGFPVRLCAGEPSILQLTPSTQVDGAGIFLDQVLEVDSGAPRLRLCDAPAFGKTTNLSRAQVQDLALAAGSEPMLAAESGPRSVRVTRRCRALAEADLVALLTTTLQQEVVKDKGELELRCSRPWRTVDVPVEPLTLKVTELPAAGVTPSFIVRFELRVGDETIGSWQASVQAHVWREVWVAGSPLKRGDSIAAAELARERRDTLMLRDVAADFESGDATLEIAEPLQTGAPVLLRSLRLRPVIRRGQLAEALLQDGALNVTMKVEALEDGVPGQSIRVRNPISRRDVRGKVVNNQTVLVTF